MEYFFSKYYRRLASYKSDLIYTSSNIFVPISGFIGSIIAVAYISPEKMGIYQSVLLVLFYTNFLHLGVFNGLNRNIAFYKARDEQNVVQEQINTSYTVAKFVSILGFIIGLTVFINEFINDRNLYFLLAILLLTINLILVPFKTHFEATFRSSAQFGLLGRIIYRENLLFSLTSLLPIALGFFGKIISDSTKAIYSFYLRFKHVSSKADGLGNTNQFSDLVKVGFPIMISGYLWGLYVVADQSYISLRLNSIQLGYYTLSKLIVTSVMVLPNSINALFYPRMSALYASTGKSSSLRKYLKKTILLNSIILAPVLFFSYLFIEDLVSKFFPNYFNGVPAAKTNILSCFTLIFMSPSVIFGIIGRNKIYLFLLALCLGLYWGVLVLFSRYFISILAIARLKFWMSLLLASLVLISSLYVTRKKE